MKCPLCKRDLKNLLEHLVVKHGLSSIDQLIQEMQKIQTDNRRRAAFSAYVQELQQKVKQGKLTWEQYRELIMKWSYEGG